MRSCSWHVALSLLLCLCICLLQAGAYASNKPLIPSAQIGLDGIPQTATPQKIKDALVDEVDDSAALAAVQSALQAVEQRRAEEADRKREEKKMKLEELKRQEEEVAQQKAQRDLELLQEQELAAEARRRKEAHAYQRKSPEGFVPATGTTGGFHTNQAHEIEAQIARESLESSSGIGLGAKLSKSTRRQELLDGRSVDGAVAEAVIADAGVGSRTVVDVTILTPDRTQAESLRREAWLRRNDGTGEYDSAEKSAVLPDVDADMSLETRRRVFSESGGLADSHEVEAEVEEEEEKDRAAAAAAAGGGKDERLTPSPPSMSEDAYEDENELAGNGAGGTPVLAPADPRIALRAAALLAEVEAKGLRADFSASSSVSDATLAGLPGLAGHATRNARFASGAANNEVADLVARLRAEEGQDPEAAWKRHLAVVEGSPLAGEASVPLAELVEASPVLERLELAAIPVHAKAAKVVRRADDEGAAVSQAVAAVEEEAEAEMSLSRELGFDDINADSRDGLGEFGELSMEEMLELFRRHEQGSGAGRGRADPLPVPEAPTAFDSLDIRGASPFSGPDTDSKYEEEEEEEDEGDVDVVPALSMEEMIEAFLGAGGDADRSNSRPKMHLQPPPAQTQDRIINDAAVGGESSFDGGMADFAAGFGDLPDVSSSIIPELPKRIDSARQAFTSSSESTGTPSWSDAALREERDFLRAALLQLGSVLKVSRAPPAAAAGLDKREWGAWQGEVLLSLEEVLSAARGGSGGGGKAPELLSTKLRICRNEHEVTRLQLESCRLETEEQRLEQERSCGAQCAAAAEVAVAQAHKDGLLSGAQPALLLTASPPVSLDAKDKNAARIDALTAAVQVCEERVLARDMQLASFRNFRRGASDSPVGVAAGGPKSELATSPLAVPGVPAAAAAVRNTPVDAASSSGASSISSEAFAESERRKKAQADADAAVEARARALPVGVQAPPKPLSPAEIPESGGVTWWASMRNAVSNWFGYGGKRSDIGLAKKRVSVGGTFATVRVRPTADDGGSDSNSNSSIDIEGNKTPEPAAVASENEARAESNDKPGRGPEASASAAYRASLSQEERASQDFAQSFYDDRGMEAAFEQVAQFLEYFYEDYCLSLELRGRKLFDSLVPLSVVRILASLWATVSWLALWVWRLLLHVPGVETAAAQVSQCSRRQLLRWTFDAADWVYQKAHLFVYSMLRFFSDDDLWERVQGYCYRIPLEVYWIIVAPVQEAVTSAVEYEGLVDGLLVRWMGADLAAPLKPSLIYGLVFLFFWKLPTAVRALHSRLLGKSDGAPSLQPRNGALSAFEARPGTSAESVGPSTPQEGRSVLKLLWATVCWPFGLLKRGGRLVVVVMSALLLVLMSPLLFLSWLYKRLWLGEKKDAGSSGSGTGGSRAARTNPASERSRMGAVRSSSASGSGSGSGSDTPRGAGAGGGSDGASGAGAGRGNLDTPRSYLKKSQAQQEQERRTRPGKWDVSSIGGALHPVAEDDAGSQYVRERAPDTHVTMMGTTAGAAVGAEQSLQALMAPPQHRTIQHRGTARLSASSTQAALEEMSKGQGQGQGQAPVGAESPSEPEPAVAGKQQKASMSLLAQTPNRHAVPPPPPPEATTPTTTAPSAISPGSNAAEQALEQAREQERGAWLQREVQRRKQLEQERLDRLFKQEQQQQQQLLLQQQQQQQQQEYQQPQEEYEQQQMQQQQPQDEDEDEQQQQDEQREEPQLRFEEVAITTPQRSPALLAPQPTAEDEAEAAELAERYHDYFNMHVSPSSSANASPKHISGPGGGGGRDSEVSNWDSYYVPPHAGTGSETEAVSFGESAGIVERELAMSDVDGVGTRNADLRVIFDQSYDNDGSASDLPRPTGATVASGRKVFTERAVQSRTPRAVSAVTAQTMDRTPLEASRPPTARWDGVVSQGQGSTVLSPQPPGSAGRVAIALSEEAEEAEEVEEEYEEAWEEETHETDEGGDRDLPGGTARPDLQPRYPHTHPYPNPPYPSSYTSDTFASGQGQMQQRVYGEAYYVPDDGAVNGAFIEAAEDSWDVDKVDVAFQSVETSQDQFRYDARSEERGRGWQGRAGGSVDQVISPDLDANVAADLEYSDVNIEAFAAAAAPANKPEARAPDDQKSRAVGQPQFPPQPKPQPSASAGNQPYNFV